MPYSLRSSSESSQGVAASFQRSLSLQDDNELFNDVKTDLRKLAKKHFDSTSTGAEQTYGSWGAFETEVSRMYPIFTQNRHALQCMRKYIKQGLSSRAYINRRAAARGNIRRRQRTRNDGPLLSSPPTHVQVQVVDMMEGLAPLSNDTRAVQAFLQSCTPSMHYLFPTFMNLGFKTEEILKGVARWPKEEFIQILERWTCAGKLTWVEAEAVRMQFMSYTGM